MPKVMSNKPDREMETSSGQIVPLWRCDITGKEYTNSKGFCALAGISPATMHRLKLRGELPVNQILPNTQMRFYLDSIKQWYNMRSQTGKVRG